MKKELMNDLLREFPMEWFEKIGSFEIGDGWFSILQNLLRELVPVASPDFKLLQVKEKFGGLRVYYNDSNYDVKHAMIVKAEWESYKTCDVCGEPGSLIRDGWWRTRCKNHENNH